MSPIVTSVRRSNAAIVFAVLAITISALCVLTPSSMHISAVVLRRSSLIATSERSDFAVRILSASFICASANSALHLPGSHSKLSATFTTLTRASASDKLSTFTWSPNRSRSCGLSSPSSGFIVPTRMNLAGCPTETPSRSTIFAPIAAESSRTSATWSSSRFTSSM